MAASLREGGVKLAKVVATAAQPVDLGARHMRDESLQVGMFAKEVLDIVRAVLGAERLVFPVDGLRESLEKNMVLVERKEHVPLRSPKDLDDVPARAGKQRLELLNDLAVPAHRAVEALKIAVYDEG